MTTGPGRIRPPSRSASFGDHCFAGDKVHSSWVSLPLMSCVEVVEGPLDLSLVLLGSACRATPPVPHCRSRPGIGDRLKLWSSCSSTSHQPQNFPLVRRRFSA